MKKFLAIWGNGFPNTYDDSIVALTESFFTDEAGYNEDQRKAINKLEEWESVGDEMLDGGHIIIRLPDNFKKWTIVFKVD